MDTCLPSCSPESSCFRCWTSSRSCGSKAKALRPCCITLDANCYLLSRVNRLTRALEAMDTCLSSCSFESSRTWCWSSSRSCDSKARALPPCAFTFNANDALLSMYTGLPELVKLWTHAYPHAALSPAASGAGALTAAAIAKQGRCVTALCFHCVNQVQYTI